MRQAEVRPQQFNGLVHDERRDGFEVRVPPLSRSDPVIRFVRLRQRFVRRLPWNGKGPDH